MIRKNLSPYLLLLAGFFYSFVTQAQKKSIIGTVKDVHSEERVPFASVSFRNTTIGKLTDSAGRFTFILNEWPADTLEITCVGYQPFFFVIQKNKDSIHADIRMERGTFNDGVKVRVKVNKGLLLWRKIVKNKPDNDRYRFDNFSYELYNKLELDIKNINFEKVSRFKPFRSVNKIITENVDTMNGAKYLPAYLTEALTDYYYQKKPKKRREIIKAANTNGVKNESVLKMLGGMDQVVNVYNNFIPVMDKQFVSPISDNGDFYYNYRVVDTQFVNQRRFYHLVFTPRRAGTNTFEGDCWVNDTTFAIQKMNLRLGKIANVNYIENLSLIQEYSLINDSTWFLAKDKFVADISPIGKDNTGFIGRKTTTYRKVVINDSSVIKELDKNKIMEEVITLPDVMLKTKEFWTTARHEELSKSEAAVITMIDTLLQAPEWKRFTKTINFIGTGYMKLGSFTIGPWYNWITSNGWEGFRVRFDLATNKRFHKKWWWHTYLAYGFGDNKLKGKAELFFLPKKHPRFYLYGSYINDLDWGQSYYGEVTQDNIFALAIRKNNIPLKYMKVEEGRFELFNELKSGFSTLLTTSHKSYTPLQNLPPKDSFSSKYDGNPLTTFEVSVRFRFAYLEKFLENHFFRTSLGSPYPTTEFYVSKGIPGVLKSNYSYWKISGNISDNIKLPPGGNLYFLLFGGKTFGTLPYMMLDVAPGNELYYYNKYAFNMMNRWEYIHDRYAGISVEHVIGNGIFRYFPRLRLRQLWTAKVLWGKLSDENKAFNFKEGYPFRTLDGKAYVEVGTGLENIFRILRIDFIWRVAPKPLPVQASRRFGIFGSIRLGF
jgi:hypothetical protein